MSNEIVNRVANSSLKTIDLEEFYPKGHRTSIDIKEWLFQELIIKESDFRASLKDHDWSQYQDHFIALTCSSDAIIPSWAYLLITTYLTPYAKKIVIGNSVDLENALFHDIILGIDLKQYENLPVIIKGCASKPIPDTAYVHLIERIQPIAKSIMFGEACSTVPLFKKK